MRARRAARFPALHALQAVAHGALTAGDGAGVLAPEVISHGMEQAAHEDQHPAQVVPVELAQLGEELPVDGRGLAPGPSSYVERT